jgi:hypothetical protein
MHLNRYPPVKTSSPPSILRSCCCAFSVILVWVCSLYASFFAGRVTRWKDAPVALMKSANLAVGYGKGVSGLPRSVDMEDALRSRLSEEDDPSPSPSLGLSVTPYKWATYYPVDSTIEAARQSIRRPTYDELKKTAIVTMATGDAAARGATALMQSLIDSGTRVPTLLVLIFRGGYGSEWCDNYKRKAMRYGDDGVRCG